MSSPGERASSESIVAARRWLESTRNLLHITVLLAVPLLIGLVTLLSNAVDSLSFLLFPPLAAGVYTLFSDPEGRYASPERFVGGLTAGALCGWIALVATEATVPAATTGDVSAGGAALGVFLTGAVTWAFDLEEPAAYSTALLVSVVGVSQFEYVASVAVSSALVAGVFVSWRARFYERRAEYLYRSREDGERVLVPVHEGAGETATVVAARLAADRADGTVVLLDVVAPDEDETAVEESTERLKALRGRLAERFDVDCERTVVADDPNSGEGLVRVAFDLGCDLIVVPWEEGSADDSGFASAVLSGEVDAVAFRGEEWREPERAFVAVEESGPVAHACCEFASRLVSGTVTVCTSVPEDETREAERTLARLVETHPERFETRVAREPIGDLIAESAPAYDLVLVGRDAGRAVADLGTPVVLVGVG